MSYERHTGWVGGGSVLDYKPHQTGCCSQPPSPVAEESRGLACRKSQPGKVSKTGSFGEQLPAGVDAA